MLLPSACSRASEPSLRSICLEGLSLRMVSAETSGSSAMPPVSEQWNQRWNEERRSQDRDTFHLRSSDSALVSRTPTISGLISTRRYAPPPSRHEHPSRQWRNRNSPCTRRGACSQSY